MLTVARTLVFCACALSFAAPSFAGECAAPIGSAALAKADADTRLRYIRQSMSDTARLERRYLIGWSLTYVGFSVGTWALVPFSDDPRQKVEAAWNSSNSAFAAITLIISPLRVIRDQQRLEALLAKQNVTQTSEARCGVLKEAERLFARVAENESGARSPFAHISGFLATIGLGLVLGYALDRPKGAAINTTMGVFLSELMIATRPTEAVRRLERYRAGNFSTPPPSRFIYFGMAPVSTGNGYGLSLAGAF